MSPRKKKGHGAQVDLKSKKGDGPCRVGEAIRGRTDPTTRIGDQLSFPFEGFPRVQAYYGIKRADEWMGVPTLQLTAAEGRAKVEELRKDGITLAEHADQLELFFRANGLGAG